jgi:hypothetical protein
MSSSIIKASTTELNVDELVEHAKRAFALKQFEIAVDRYASALEIMFVWSSHLVLEN